MNIADLLAEAESLAPAQPARSYRWANLFPVYERLRQKGMTVRASIEWLRIKGALDHTEIEKAANAFQVLTTRRRKQASKTKDQRQ